MLAPTLPLRNPGYATGIIGPFVPGSHRSLVLPFANPVAHCSCDMMVPWFCGLMGHWFNRSLILPYYYSGRSRSSPWARGVEHMRVHVPPPPPPPPWFWSDMIFCIPVCIRILKNKAQIARESIKNPKASRAFKRALDPGRKDFGLCACNVLAHT